MNKFALGLAATVISTTALGMDQGPKVVGCDWINNKTQVHNTEVCLILAQGFFTGGIELLAVRIGNRQQMYLFENDRARLFNGSSVDTPLLWEGKVSDEQAQCRPAGPVTTRYNISDGLSLCLYDK